MIRSCASYSDDQLLPALVMVPVCIAIGCGVWWFKPLPAKIENAAPKTVTLSADPQLQWESGADEMELLRGDFEPIESRTKKPWDIEPTKE